MQIEQMFGVGAFESEHPAITIQRTELGRYAECPQKARLCQEHEAEIDRHEVLPETGTLVHGIAEEAVKACDMDLQEAADYIAEELPKIRPDLQPEALRAGRNLANELRRFESNRVLLCEETITRSVLPATAKRGEVLVCIQPDLVLATSKADTIIVLDYKTGYKQRSSQEARDDFQTCVGSWCLFAKYPDVNTIHWFYLETRTNSRAYARIERTSVVGPNELTQEMAFQARIEQAVQIMLSGDDEAWPNPDKCAMCPVARWCKAADYEAKDLNGNVQKYIDSYVVLNQRVTEMADTMKAAVREGRVLYGSSSKFDFDPRPSFRPKLESTEPKKAKKKSKPKAKKKTAKKRKTEAA